MGRSTLLGLLLLAAVAVALLMNWARVDPPATNKAPSPTESSRVLRPGESEGEGAVTRVDARQQHQGSDSSTKSPQVIAIEESLGQSLGLMSVEDKERARLTLNSLRDASTSELKAFQDSCKGKYDAQTAAREASLLRSALLWDAVAEALERGDYWLGYEYPTRLPRSTREVHYQDLSVTKDGKAAAAVFFISNGTGAGSNFVGASDYYSSQQKFWLQEAAYSFNSLPDHERSSLYSQYKDIVSSKGFDRLPQELATRFPFGTVVDEVTFIMRAPK